jgi:hypothetical protein
MGARVETVRRNISCESKIGAFSGKTKLQKRKAGSKRGENAAEIFT